MECANETLGSALFKTLNKCQDKVLYADDKNYTKRLVGWALQMRDHGYFDQCPAKEPTKNFCAKCLDDSERELKNVPGNCEWSKMAFQTDCYETHA